ncbi:mitochondrial fission ELM1 family protein [Pseudoxanthomonas sp. UTMC 1351]|uniref:mitochondrial fission ELM1 family protein n=1 Tax=Pseudoxanthomonas sp. UTMC 1351 TaxID=2695853 RepID=UPI0034CECA51
MEQIPAFALDSARLWTLTDGNAGNLRQAEALARALKFDGSAKHWKLAPHAPWRWWAPRLGPAAGHAFGTAFAHALAVPPQVAIGCGRQGALATRLLRRQGAKTVQILDPRIDPHHWDLVIAPEHDGLQGRNVVQVQGSLNPVDDAWLMEARQRFATFADLPQPRTAVLLGGNSAHARFDRGAFEVLAAKLEVALAREGGSLLVTTSRRTSEKVIAPLRHRFIETPGVVWCGEADGENPYAGLLAWADRIVCSPDSVNMISEACATRVPVHVFDPARVRGRPRRFLDALLRSGRIRAVDGALANFDVEPLRETARVAAIVRERLAL